MSGGRLEVLVSVVVPTMALFLLLRWIARVLRWPGFGRRWLPMVLLGLSAAAVLVPVQGLSGARWLAGIVPTFSIPLVAVLLHWTLRALEGPGLFRAADFRALWLFGVGAGLVLYPMALGWGPWDPYALGWGRSWLFAALGAGAALLCVLGNRLGCVLLAAIVAWHLRLLESDNYWDYLVDPIWVVMSLLLLGGTSSTSPQLPSPRPWTTPGNDSPPGTRT